MKQINSSSECATVFLAAFSAHIMDKAVYTCLFAILAGTAHAYPVKVLQLFNTGAPSVALTTMRINTHRWDVLLANAGA